MILAVLTSLWSYRNGRERLVGPIAKPPQPPTERRLDGPGENNGSRLASLPPEVEHRETETYLCGIGRLDSESGYFIRRGKAMMTSGLGR